jgi:hypothetical protein
MATFELRSRPNRSLRTGRVWCQLVGNVCDWHRQRFFESATAGNSALGIKSTDAVQLSAALALHAGRSLGHVFQTLWWNIDTAVGTLPVCAILNTHQCSTDSPQLRLNIPTSVFGHLVLLVLVHKREATDRRVHLRTIVSATRFFQALRQLLLQFLQLVLRSSQRVVISRHGYSPSGGPWAQRGSTEY